MGRISRVAASLTAILLAQAALAQSWVQVEARPSEAEALERAADYASRISDVNGFRLRSGWYAITLGPYDDDVARGRLLELRAARAVPSDSFISDGTNYRERFFGSDTALVRPEPVTPAVPLVAGEESVEEAISSERLLSRDEREFLQVALRWEGYYNSAIDGSFGPGTRRSMAAWQEANGFEPTGVLTTLQRRQIVEDYQLVLRSLDLRPMTDTQAGIEMVMPFGLVQFDRYESPFAHYTPATDDGVRLTLISQTGDETTLAALYDILQTLAIVPLNGPRQLRRDDFSIEGANSTIVSKTVVRLADGAVKGFTLTWPAGDEKRFRLALDAMEGSFRQIGGVLPDNAGNAAQDIDLLSGLEIRRPERERSGFFVGSDGAVLTTAEAVRQCTRITLNDETEAQVAAEDGTLGLVLLKPLQTLVPITVARLAASQPRLQSDIAVAGYSYGGILNAPSLSFGTLADVKGLDGDTRLQRLDVANLPEDAGGPVFDASGAILGMLLDRNDGTRQLPENVAFAADAPVLAEFLSAHGINPAAGDAGDSMAPEDLTLLASDLTVLVSCWN